MMRAKLISVDSKMSNFRKVFSLNAVSLLARTIASLILNKCLALVGGPAVFVVLGQVQNAYQIFTTSILGGGNLVATKSLSDGELRDSQKSQIATVGLLVNITIATLTTIFFSLALVFSEQGVFGFDSKVAFLAVCVISIIPLAISSYILSVMNGIGDLKGFVISGIIQSFILIALVLLFTMLDDAQGIILAYVIAQPISLIYSVIRIYKAYPFQINIHTINWIKIFDNLRVFKPYFIISIVGMSLPPITVIICREVYRVNFPESVVGLWEAAYRTNQLFFVPLTSILSIYFLPLFSFKGNVSLPNLRDKRLLMPFIFIILALITFFIYSPEILTLLYSLEFVNGAPLANLFIIGGTIQFVTMIIQYGYISQGQAKEYLSNEFVRALSILIISVFLILLFNKILVVGYAFVLANFIVLVKQVLQLKKTRRAGAK